MPNPSEACASIALRKLNASIHSVERSIKKVGIWSILKLFKVCRSSEVHQHANALSEYCAFMTDFMAKSIAILIGILASSSIQSI